MFKLQKKRKYMKNLLAFLFILIPLSVGAESTSGTVESISTEYGNLETSITSETLGSLGIKVNDHFVMAYRSAKITVYFGKTYCISMSDTNKRLKVLLYRESRRI